MGHPVEQEGSRELELAEKVIIFGERTFTLENLDQDGGLVIYSGGKGFNPGRLLRGQGRLSLLDLPLQISHGSQVRGNIGTGILLVSVDKVTR